MNEDILVTVVVPVYNVEKYIKKCIESIINQTYKNIEVIIVNDGTKDNSLEIANKMAEKDNRIKVISQENQGLSMARNTGIKNARGEYICFIDSDDFIDENYIKLLLENILEKDADISACDFLYIDEKNKIWSTGEKKEKVYTNIEAIKDILSGKQDTGMITWNKLYKLNLFKKNNIFFPKGRIHEDNFTTYKLYYYSTKVSFIPNKLYYYLQRTNSIMGKKFNVKRLDLLCAIEETKEFFLKENVKLEDELEIYDILAKIMILNNMIRDKFEGKEKQEIIDDLKKNKKRYYKNKYISKKIKYALFLIAEKGKIYSLCLHILDKINKA